MYDSFPVLFCFWISVWPVQTRSTCSSAKLKMSTFPHAFCCWRLDSCCTAVSSHHPLLSQTDASGAAAPAAS